MVASRVMGRALKGARPNGEAMSQGDCPEMSILNRKQRRNPPPPTLLDAQVLRLREWAELAGVSMRTARRILASGTGPRIVQLSSKRVGISVAAHKQWLAARERAS